ncbi:hypothetical protein AAY473_021515 [Plecturocebus cupreus]
MGRPIQDQGRPGTTAHACNPRQNHQQDIGNAFCLQVALQLQANVILSSFMTRAMQVSRCHSTSSSKSSSTYNPWALPLPNYGTKGLSQLVLKVRGRARHGGSRLESQHFGEAKAGRSQGQGIETNLANITGASPGIRLHKQASGLETPGSSPPLQVEHANRVHGKAQWLMPVTPAFWKSEVEGSLELSSSRPAWAT